MEGRSSNGIVRNQGIRIENPFTLKVGQVFTGFGVGCGVGTGFGRQLNLEMHRSSSSSRLSGELLVPSSFNSSQSSSFRPTLEADQQLPTFNPLPYVTKKEHSHLRSAENAIHLIPTLLLVCAIILWFFSISESRVG
ncbi:putative Transmembrane protein [Quillaja saponaria]|uniref:Transmembrane protein n=1 Tax=Quillaja saponaria TaxID=32244 RepID=A0AAD7PED7_QUISA|nr:putative Transmembrane protein [Quillaja saponaria]